MGHVVDLREFRLFEREPCFGRAAAAAADQDHRPIGNVCRKLSDFGNEIRIQLPIGRLAPRHMIGAGRVTDEEVLRIAATVNKERIRVLPDERVRLARKQMLHAALLGKQRGKVTERLELKRVARRVEKKHGGLFPDFTLEANVRLDDEALTRGP